MRITALILVITLMSGCAMLKNLAMEAVSPSKGGINTELVVGDKEQTLGTNQEVKASQIGTVVGQNDNHTDIAKAEEVSIVNQSFPAWMILLLLVSNVVGWVADSPQSIWRKWHGRFQNKL